MFLNRTNQVNAKKPILQQATKSKPIARKNKEIQEEINLLDESLDIIGIKNKDVTDFIKKKAELINELL